MGGNWYNKKKNTKNEQKVHALQLFDRFIVF